MSAEDPLRVLRPICFKDLHPTQLVNRQAARPKFLIPLFWRRTKAYEAEGAVMQVRSRPHPETDDLSTTRNRTLAARHSWTEAKALGPWAV